jgi:hypothetical protein
VRVRLRLMGVPVGRSRWWLRVVTCSWIQDLPDDGTPCGDLDQHEMAGGSARLELCRQGLEGLPAGPVVIRGRKDLHTARTSMFEAVALSRGVVGALGDDTEDEHPQGQRRQESNTIEQDHSRERASCTNWT